jgi:hypothetical protein
VNIVADSLLFFHMCSFFFAEDGRKYLWNVSIYEAIEGKTKKIKKYKVLCCMFEKQFSIT